MEVLAGLWAMGLTTGFVVWVLRSVSRHWERKHQRQMGGPPGSEQLADRVAELERRLHAMGSALEDRLTEIEERQDFSERLVTQTARDQLSQERN